jgi:catechol 2,3-dioxygenase-like lactoylglutathione lyase family enzyme
MRPVMTHLAFHVRDLEACVAFYRDWCGTVEVHRREGVAWLAEPGKERDFIFVLLEGGPGRDQAAGDYSHLGFALDSRDAVDVLAERARAAGILVWEPRQDPYPAGYYCGVKDPDGNMIEFSHGQPLGPGAEPLSESP